MSKVTKIEITEGEQHNNINFTLQNSAGTAINLTGATLKLKAQKTGETELAVNGNMVIVSAAAGTCYYQTQDGDFEEGTYDAHIEITFTTGEVAIYPDIVIIVKPELPK